MERLQKAGLTKCIGLSNAPVNTLNDFLSHCEIKPTLNQIELHPYLA